MKNKFIQAVAAGVLAAMMTVSTVFAAPSIVANVTVVNTAATATDASGNKIEGATVSLQTSKNNQLVTEIPETAKKEVETLNKAIDTAIASGKTEEFTAAVKEMVTAGSIELADTTDTFQVEKMAPLTDVQDIVVRDKDGKVISDATNIEAKIELPSLVEGMGEIRIMHFDTKLNKWVIIKPEVDFTSKTLKFTLPNPGPIMVVYEPAEAK